MRLPFFNRDDKPVRLPLSDMVQHGVGVYFKSRTPAPPTAEQLLPVVQAWVRRNAPGPLGEMLQAWLDKELVSLGVGTRDLLPTPPLEFLQLTSPGELEERRFEEATHLVVVSSPDSLRYPFLGFWATMAAARALAEASQGVIFDPATMRLLPASTHGEPLPENGFLRIPEHFVLPVSTGNRGLGWMTTKGLGRWDLPELEMRDFPPDLARMLMPLMNALILTVLARAVAAQEATPEGSKPVLEFSGEVRLEVEALSHAVGAEPPARPEGARGWTELRFQYRKQRGGDSFLSVEPPPYFKRSRSEWFHSLISDLVPSNEEENMGYVPADDERMEAAHREAVAALPAVKQRFLAGLQPGETLFVKHGFPLLGEEAHEYMWVVVTRWSGDRLQGKLSSEPLQRLDLRAGQAVELRDGEVYDWVLSRHDGSHEGNYTARALGH